MGNLNHTISNSHAVRFNSAARVPITSLKANFVPTQLGSGDPNPENVRTISGRQGCNFYLNESPNLFKNVTIANGYRDSSGTFVSSVNSYYITNAYEIDINNLDLYHLYIGPVGVYGVKLYYLDANEQWISRSDYFSGNSVTGEFDLSLNRFQFPQDCKKIQIQFISTVDINKVKFFKTKKIAITFPAIGKNLLNMNNVSVERADSGMAIGGTVRNAKPDGSLTLKAGTYTFSINTIATAMVINNNQGGMVIQPTPNVSSVTFTLPSEQSIRIVIVKNNTTPEEFQTFNFQLEEGSSATTYEPFDNTLYGGTIDLINGSISQCIRKLTFNGTENFTNYSTQSNTITFQLKAADFDSTIAGNVRVYMSYLTANSEFTTPWTFWVIAGKNKLLITVPNTYTLETFKTYLSEHPLEFAYATTQKYYFSPMQLKTMLGENSITADTNSTREVSYAIHDSKEMMEARKRIILNEPHLATSSGNIATFNADLIAPIKSAKIYFNPIQSGTGDPSPTNIRPISGWYTARLFQAQEIIPIVPNNWSTESKNDLTFTYSNNNTFIATGITNSRTTFLIPINTITLDQNLTYNIIIYIDPNPTLVAEEQGNGNIMLGFMQNNSPLFTSRNNFTATARYTINTITNGTFNKDYQLNKLAIGLIQGCGNFTIHIQITPNLTNNLIINCSSEEELYGGYIDLSSGELVQTYGCTNTTWGNYNHSYDSISGGNAVLTNYERRIFTLDNPFKPNNLNPVELCNVSPLITNGYGDDAPFFTMGNSIAILKLPVGTNDDFPIQFVGELTTPITYQLTPTQLKSLIGTNNIWSNTNGNIEIQYWTH